MKRNNSKHDLDNLVGQVLEQQSLSTAYRRGVSALGRIKEGDHFIDAKLEAVKLGYPTHTQENHLFVEGFLDAMQDNGIVIHTDAHHVIEAIASVHHDDVTIH